MVRNHEYPFVGACNHHSTLVTREVGSDVSSCIQQEQINLPAVQLAKLKARFAAETGSRAAAWSGVPSTKYSVALRIVLHIAPFSAVSAENLRRVSACHLPALGRTLA